MRLCSKPISPAQWRCGPGAGAGPGLRPHSPEDLILNKLRLYRISQQTKHVRDIASIVLSQAKALDMAYIERWVQTLNLTAEWRAIQQRITSL